MLQFLGSIFGVLQGSILGPLLFNSFLWSSFYNDDINIANYADDNTSFVSGDTQLHVIRSLETAAENFFEWFTKNQINGNHVKFHLLMNTLTAISIKVKNSVMKNSDNENFLGITVDENLNKASENVLTRITRYMSVPERKILMNSFFTLQFNYFPLNCICHSVTMNNQLIGCVKGASSLFIGIRHHLLKSY